MNHEEILKGVSIIEPVLEVVGSVTLESFLAFVGTLIDEYGIRNHMSSSEIRFASAILLTVQSEVHNELGLEEEEIL